VGDRRRGDGGLRPGRAGAPRRRGRGRRVDLPPVEAFWSLSVYGDDMFFTEHPSGRYTIGDRTPGLTFGDDGSLELVLSHDEPPTVADGRPVNWLPVPEGPFVLMLRLYLPGDAVLEGDYRYPAVRRIASD
jgi:hypothetical protein